MQAIDNTLINIAPVSFSETYFFFLFLNTKEL